jgi:hypothetical protein
MQNIKYKIDKHLSNELYKNINKNDLCNFMLSTAIQANTRTYISNNTIINTLSPIINNINHINPISTQKEYI